MANLLIVYFNTEYPMRATIADHLYCFRRYSDNNCYYLNLATNEVPAYIDKIPFDIIIFHTRFLAQRWNLTQFALLTEKVLRLKDINAIRIALPQDEFIHTDALCLFINRLQIKYVFSVAPESEWPKIYDNIDRENVRLFPVLTGYLDERTVQQINKIARSISRRDVDIGYRAYRALPWLGRHGMLKTQIAEIFSVKAREADYAIDISTRSKDTLLSYEWYKFLLRCKYTIGVEGGASILDRTGAIRETTERYLSLNPSASFEEVEKACFPGIDGNLKLFAISPRHLEACATKTCQILITGEYNGILQADRHYIPLEADFSNINYVLQLLKRDELRKRIADQAYSDIVEAGKCSYREFVGFIIKNTLGPAKADGIGVPRLYHFLMLSTEKLSAFIIVLYALFKRTIYLFVSPDTVRRVRKKFIGY